MQIVGCDSLYMEVMDEEESEMTSRDSVGVVQPMGNLAASLSKRAPWA
jgi:hypothetical protein